MHKSIYSTENIFDTTIYCVSCRKNLVCQTQNKLETGEKIRYLLNFGIIQENLTNFAGCDF